MTNTTNTTYNGWTNYETWLVNLWLTNEQGSDELVREWADEFVQDAIDKGCDSDSIRNDAAYELGERIKDMHEENTPEITGLHADLINAALGAVNWYEIAKHFIDDIEIYAAGWNMPGYMPDSDPVLFTDEDAALEYIKDAVRNLDPEIYPAAGDWAESMEADAKGEFSAKAADYVYWVSKV
jgi:hypothetical protein